MPVRTRRPLRVAALVALAGCLTGLAVGCQLFQNRGPTRPVPLPPGVKPNDLVDREARYESENPLTAEELIEAEKEIRQFLANRVKKARAEATVPVPEKAKSVLVLSGGGSYGAYPAGVLVGWSQSGLPPEQGGRPTFDVVTGISTGALIAPLAFLGPKYDEVLRREYTTVTNDDIYTRRGLIRGLFSESIADSAPLRHRVEALVTYELMAEAAEEHRKGRRLYVGTTNLDTKRLVVWDLGAIATRGTPEARQLIIDAMIASASIPAFLPSVRMRVDIDGQVYEEMHVDGGSTRSMFFRPPYVDRATKAEAANPTRYELFGTNLYIMVAGKMYADPEGVRPRVLRMALASLTSLLYSQTRLDLDQLYNYSLLTGMHYFVSAIPDDLPTPQQASEFDPVQMGRMFCAGYNLGRYGTLQKVPTKELDRIPNKDVRAIRDEKDGTTVITGPAWQNRPPALKPGQELRARAGLRLTVERTEDRPASPAPPEPSGPPVAPPPRPVVEPPRVPQ